MAVAIAAATLLSLTPVVSAQPDASRPNIVVIYMDDFSPNAPELWSDPDRTPALARFVDEGTWLSGGIGSTPRCCPARANILTGQWSHRNGVTENDMGPYKPRTSIAVKLKQQGYHTLFGGKFLNRMPLYTPTYESVLPYAVGWDEFDALWTNHGEFYRYRLWTRDGVKRHRRRATDHSTFVVTQRMQKHIRDAPPDQPIFAFVSLFHGHDPNLPLRRFKKDPACRGESWAGPSFNEADVSDKPQYVQQRELVDEEAYDLQTRCEEILSVDWSAGKIMQVLERTGRLENTMFLFTADNGYLMREHRIEDKKAPYSTPVPTYVLWPARWGNQPRQLTEPVSNVDMAPTFCALAGCSIKRADGISLLPLLDGEVEALDRQFIYEESLHDRGIPAWYGLRTTGGYDPDARWVYTEYQTGEHELYDLIADPFQLENRAGQADYEAVETELREMLHAEVIEPHEVRWQ